MIAALLRAVLWFGVRLLTGVRTLPDALVSGPAVLFANHTSHFDTLVVWAAADEDLRRRLRPVAAHDYWGVGRVRSWIGRELLNVLLVDRVVEGRSRDPVDVMVEALDAGAVLLLFPEGTRTPEGTLGAFKAGLYHLAMQRPDVPMVPMFLENPGRALPKGEVIPVPVICGVHPGEPMRLAPGEDKAAFLIRARAAVRALGGPAFVEET